MFEALAQGRRADESAERVAHFVEREVREEAAWDADATLETPEESVEDVDALQVHHLAVLAPGRDALEEPEREREEREAEVLDLISKGLSNQEIATALTINDRKVSAHGSSLLRKLHLASRTQAALYAIRMGWVRPDETPRNG